MITPLFYISPSVAFIEIARSRNQLKSEISLNQNQTNMENSLATIMASENKTGTITVKLLQNTNSEDLFIVGDGSNYALLNLSSHPEYSKLVKVENAYKFIKCTVDNDQITPSSFKPIQSKAKIEITANKKKLEKIVKMANSLTPKTKTSQLEEIEKEAKVNSYHSNLTVMVTKVSRKIEGSNGAYKISTVTDSNNYRAELNLYEPHLDTLEVGKIIKMDKVKKIMINEKMRLCAVRFTMITKDEDAKTKDAFKDVTIGQNKTLGIVEGIVDVSYYQSCKVHMCKIDMDNRCHHCNQEVQETQHNLTAIMYLTTADDTIQIRCWKSQMKFLTDKDTEEEIAVKINQVEGTEMTVEYDENTDGQNILVRIV